MYPVTNGKSPKDETGELRDSVCSFGDITLVAVWTMDYRAKAKVTGRLGVEVL